MHHCSLEFRDPFHIPYIFQVYTWVLHSVLRLYPSSQELKCLQDGFQVHQGLTSFDSIPLLGMCSLGMSLKRWCGHLSSACTAVHLKTLLNVLSLSLPFISRDVIMNERVTSNAYRVHLMKGWAWESQDTSQDFYRVSNKVSYNGIWLFWF